MTSSIVKNRWPSLVVLIAVCFAAGWIGSLATAPKINTWYAALIKPAWTPQGWIFAPVWSLLYLCMAVAAWLIWRHDGWPKASLPMTLFGLQLLLNAAWSWLFFGLKNPGLAFYDILALWAAIAATTVAFWGRSRAAGLLFIPYLLWVSFAAVLNCAIWRLNAN